MQDSDNQHDLKPLLPKLLTVYLRLMKEVDHEELVSSLTVSKMNIPPYSILNIH